MININIIKDEKRGIFKKIDFFIKINGKINMVSISRIRNINIKLIKLIDKLFLNIFILLNPHSKGRE